MKLIKTTTVISEDQKEVLKKMTYETHRSMAWLIRDAVAEYIRVNKHSNSKEELKKYAGIWKHRSDIKNPSLYIKKLREKDRERFSRLFK